MVRDFIQTEKLNEAYFHIFELEDTHKYLVRNLG